MSYQPLPGLSTSGNPASPKHIGFNRACPPAESKWQPPPYPGNTLSSSEVALHQKTHVNSAPNHFHAWQSQFFAPHSQSIPPQMPQNLSTSISTISQPPGGSVAFHPPQPSPPSHQPFRPHHVPSDDVASWTLHAPMTPNNTGNNGLKEKEDGEVSERDTSDPLTLLPESKRPRISSPPSRPRSRPHQLDWQSNVPSRPLSRARNERRAKSGYDSYRPYHGESRQPFQASAHGTHV